MMHRYLLFYIVLFLVTLTNCAIQVTVDNIVINFQKQIKQLFNNCNGVNADFFVQITSSSYSSQQTYSVQQYDASSTTLTFSNSSVFTIPQYTSFVSVSAILSLTCGTVSPLTDSFLLFTQSSSDADLNNVQNSYQATSTTQQWTLTARVVRRCLNGYGFNCDQTCVTIDDGYHCFTCGSYGQKTCCSGLNVNQTDCSYFNAISTTQNPNMYCDMYYQDLYFWFMIAFVIFSFVLLVLLIALLLLYCGYCARSKKAEEVNSVDEWSEPIEPKANRTLYDGHVNRPYSKRENRSQSRSPVPYFIHREGLENQIFEEESLSNEWIEPQPRRVARV